VEAIVREHWAKFGRNYYTRHDYEAIPTDAANGIMSRLRERLPSLPGTTLGGERVAAADDFTYHDPVDGSTSAKQGLRVMFESGARIVYRLSGTGTEGATLRIYIERYEPDAAKHDLDAQDALASLIDTALSLSELRERTGRDRPTVIT
jgi:phosphoglucomutase